MNFEKLRSLQQLRLLVRRFELESEKVVGMRATALRLKPMKSQWGSCNSKGVVAINTKLMYLPERLVGYVVHHEAVHLKIHKHDKYFRSMVGELYPDRLLLDKQLHNYASLLREK